VAVDGTILAFCEARKNIAYDWGEIHVGLRRSTDNGASWTKIQIVASNGEDTAGNPCVVVDRDTGAVWLMYCRNNNSVYVCKSEDNGVSWSKPREITLDVKLGGWTWYGTGPGHGIQLKNGRLVIPSYHGEDVRHHPIYTRSHTVYSDDHGETWKVGGVLGAGSSECEAAEMNSGSLYMTMRNGDGEFKVRLASTSLDGGDNWSEIVEVEDILDPGCMGSVATLPDSDNYSNEMLLICCPASTTRRQNLTLRGSYDSGVTWPVSTVLFPGFAGYSDLATGPDNIIYCMYERGTNLYTDRIVLAEFNREWLESIRSPLTNFRGNRIATGTGWRLKEEWE
jgi:sialidase-1